MWYCRAVLAAHLFSQHKFDGDIVDEVEVFKNQKQV